MSEREDNAIKPYAGIWSYRYWFAVAPIGTLMGVLAYFKAGGVWPF